MIELRNLSKTYRMDGMSKTVLYPTTMRLPRGRTIGLVGRNGAGKSTLLRMIAGTQAASGGTIRLHGTVSWPVGFAGSFHPDLSGAQNARFVARIYGVDSDELIGFAEDFAELGGHFRLPVRTYSSGMLSRLAFALSMGIAFDCYLVDEVTAVGDAGFRAKSERMFRARMRGAGGIVVNHSDAVIRDLCDCVLLLEGGRLTWYEDVAEALRQHQRNMTG